MCNEAERWSKEAKTTTTRTIITTTSKQTRKQTNKTHTSKQMIDEKSKQLCSSIVQQSEVREDGKGEFRGKKRQTNKYNQ